MKYHKFINNRIKQLK